MRLRDTSEGELLDQIFPLYSRTRPPAWGSVPVGPGDDAAVVGAPGGSVVATTDSMVRGLDWRDEWSSAHDVGVKVATGDASCMTCGNISAAAAANTTPAARCCMALTKLALGLRNSDRSAPAITSASAWKKGSVAIWY